MCKKAIYSQFLPVHLLNEESCSVHLSRSVAVHSIVVLDPACSSVLLLLQLPISCVAVLNQECCMLLPVLNSWEVLPLGLKQKN